MTHTKTVRECIRFLEDCEDGLSENEKVRQGYHCAINFLNDYLIETQDEADQAYNEKYAPAESYYNF